MKRELITSVPLLGEQTSYAKSDPVWAVVSSGHKELESELHLQLAYKVPSYQGASFTELMDKPVSKRNLFPDNDGEHAADEHAPLTLLLTTSALSESRFKNGSG